MLRAWFSRISGGPDCSLPESEHDIETAPEASKPSFMARLFDSKPVAVAIRRNQDGGGFHAADEQEMEEGGMTSRSSYGYSGNGGNTQQLAVLWQAGASSVWDAAATGVKGDATAVVNLYRRKLAPAVQAEKQQPRPPLPPSQTMAAMAAPPPPMAIPAWLQRRKAILPSAAEARPAPNLQPPHAPAPPCPLRPCPPSSTGPGSLRVESFTAGTGGRLMRPGVGIGAGLMREARYSDLRFIHQIGEGGFGKVRGDERPVVHM